MAIYEIEQYEIHVQTYQVEADSEAEAIAKLFRGDGEAVDDSLEFVQVADDWGLPAEEFAELAESLRGMDLTVDDVIPSIRSVERVND